MKMNQQSKNSNQEIKESNIDALNSLKRKIFGGEDEENSQTRVLIQIMREVGGYENLMNMPIPAVKEVYDFLKWESKDINKKMPKGRR